MDTNTTKLVEWAYPTSSAATHHGYGKVGCYLVRTYTMDNGKFSVNHISAHPTKSEAMAEAEKLPHEWNWMFLKHGCA